MDRLIEAALRGAGIPEGSGLDLIVKERFRQVREEGYTAKHDKQHSDGSMALLACCYALKHTDIEDKGIADQASMFLKYQKDFLPKFGDKVKNLKRAGALIAAELDRVLTEDGVE